MQEWINHHQSIWIVLFPGYFLVLWLAVSTVISFLGGWTTLAKHFRSRKPFVTKVLKWQSGQMRYLAGYRNCLTVGASDDGLYLAMMPLFRFRHPPLLIPWSEITVQHKRLFHLPFVRLGLGRDLNIPLYLRTKLADSLRVEAGARWPFEGINTQ